MRQRWCPEGELNPQGAKHRRILREEIQSTREYYRVLLSASDAGLRKIALRSNTLQCYSLRLLPVTTVSQNHRYAVPFQAIY
jgi:hypothetical protein